MYTEQILMAFNVDGLIYPFVQNVYKTDLFNVDGLIYPLVQIFLSLIFTSTHDRSF